MQPGFLLQRDKKRAAIINGRWIFFEVTTETAEVTDRNLADETASEAGFESPTS